MTDNTNSAALDERALFESIEQARGTDLRKAFEFGRRGEYANPAVQNRWEGWQMARQAAPEAPATTASADLSKRLRIKAGMITMGEKIAWGSDAALMIEAAAHIDGRTAGTAWISVEDRMPENGADVVIVGPAYGDWAKGRYAGIAHHVDGVFYDEDGNDMHPPSHWIAAAPSIATKETP